MRPRYSGRSAPGGAPAGTRAEGGRQRLFYLSICDWRGEGVGLVKLLIDAAPSAELRFFNQLSEQLQFHNADPERKPRQIKGAGRDSAYGGAGAWWTRSGSMLVAFKAKKILRVRVNVAGLGDPDSRRAAVIVAKRAFARLSEPAASAASTHNPAAWVSAKPV
jgi:hypothetical protein